VIVLGRIVAPYGVGGWVRIHAFADDPAAWGKLERWWISPVDDPDSPAWQPIGLEKFKFHGDKLLAKLSGVDDRNGSEAIDRRFIGVPRDLLPATSGNEFYWADLVGLEVSNLQGESLGLVKGLLETGAHSVLVVQNGDKEQLLPFVAHVVMEVDLGARKVQVDWGSDW
jgi:16S rRNA processing protein RimM